MVRTIASSKVYFTSVDCLHMYHREGRHWGKRGVGQLWLETEGIRRESRKRAHRDKEEEEEDKGRGRRV